MKHQAQIGLKLSHNQSLKVGKLLEVPANKKQRFVLCLSLWNPTIKDNGKAKYYLEGVIAET